MFGSAAPRPDSDDYEKAREVGRLLARAGFTVATGGYSGTMAAVSQGAHEAGGHVVGVTSTRIESFRTMGANEWVLEEIRFETLRDRLLHLVTNNDGMIALPGGIGTLSEVALAWSFLQVAEIETRPLVLLGDIWRETIQTFYRPEYIAPRHMEMIRFAGTPEEAIAHILQRQEGPS